MHEHSSCYNSSNERTSLRADTANRKLVPLLLVTELLLLGCHSVVAKLQACQQGTRYHFGSDTHGIYFNL